MDTEHNVRAREIQILVAAFQVRAAKICSGEFRLLQHGAHGAIEHEDALPKQFAEGQALLDQVLHGAHTIFSRLKQSRNAVRTLCRIVVNAEQSGPKKPRGAVSWESEECLQCMEKFFLGN